MIRIIMTTMQVTLDSYVLDSWLIKKNSNRGQWNQTFNTFVIYVQYISQFRLLQIKFLQMFLF